MGVTLLQNGAVGWRRSGVDWEGCKDNVMSAHLKPTHAVRLHTDTQHHNNHSLTIILLVIQMDVAPCESPRKSQIFKELLVNVCDLCKRNILDFLI